MITTTTPVLAPFAPAHLQQALDLSRQAGWPHRTEDWAFTLSASEGVVALEGDRVVGTALCSPFGDAAMLNMIIVDEEMRGRGLGRALMQAVMERAADREMRLVATAEGLPLYEKLGFLTVGRIFQHQGVAMAGPLQAGVRRGGIDDLPRIVSMDRAATHLPREDLLRRILQDGEVLLAEGGFALLREFGRGRVLGPVVADDTATATALLSAAATRCAGTFLRVDLRGDALRDAAVSAGLAHAGGGIAMTRGARVAPPTTYALVSQALG